MNRIQLMKTVAPLFFKYGYRSLKVDMIAEKLGISKKTIYTLFSSKKKLIQEVLSYQRDMVKNMHHDLQQNAENGIEEFIQMILKIGFLVPFNSQIRNLYELKRYYPEIYSHNLTNLFHLTKDIVSSTLKRGRDEGLFLERFPVSDLALSFTYVYLGFITTLESFALDTEAREKQLDVFITNFLYASLNDKGREVLEESREKILSWRKDFTDHAEQQKKEWKTD